MRNIVRIERKESRRRLVSIRAAQAKAQVFGSRLALGEVHRELDQRLALGNEILMDPPYTHRINPT